MARSTRTTLVPVLPLLLAAACTLPACGADTETEPALSAKLEADTGVSWGIVVDPRNQSARVLTPASPVRLGAGTPEADARTFFERYGAQLGAAGHELRVQVLEPEAGGGTFVRFQHYLAGTDVRVFDVVSMAHFRADGRAYLLQPGFRAGLDGIAKEPAIAKEAAVRAAASRVAADCGPTASTQPVRDPELGVAADEDQPLALAYRIAFHDVTATCLAPEVDVDAMTGAILRVHAGGAALTDHAGGVRFYMLHEADDVKNLDVSAHDPLFGDRSYTLETEAAPKVITQSFVARKDGVSTGRDYVQSSLGRWDATDPLGPGAAVDAHYHVTQALRYFREVHGRRSIDGSNGEVHVLVHDNPGNAGGPNAHYARVDEPAWLFFHVTRDRVSVGDGDVWQTTNPNRHDFLPLSAAFDVMAHEVSHGVIRHTAGLVYQFESGALDETMADVMGVNADHWLDPRRHADGSGLLGDRLSARGEPMRDLIDPERVVPARQRSRWDTRFTCAPNEAPDPMKNDFCGVHFNSGIGSRAWSLMTFGGTHKLTRISVPAALGFERSRTLWYETITRLSPQATFLEAAVKQLTWAAQFQPESITAIGCAWHAVGVLPFDASVSPLAVTLVCPLDPVVAPSAPPGPPAPPPAPAPAGSACSGRANGWVCDPSAPASAYACNAGAPSGTVTCADLAARCKPASPTDPTATVDSVGVLLCE